jgi:signal transduction histidine kinase
MTKKIGLILISIIFITFLIMRYINNYIYDVIYNNYINDEDTTLISFRLGNESDIPYIPEYILTQCSKYNCESIMLYLHKQQSMYKLINITRSIHTINNVEIVTYDYNVLSTLLLDKIDLDKYHKAKYVPNLEYRLISKELDMAVYNIRIMIMSILTFVFLLIDYIVFVILMKKVVFSSKIIKFELESDLNKNITDVLHHELLAPYSIINNELDSLLDSLNSKEDLKPKHDQIRSQLNNCKLACDSIYNIINLFNKSKKLKTGSRFKPSLAELITDSFENVKLFNINPNIKLNLENKSMLNIYTIVPDFGNGGFCNIFTILFNNSIEAYANTLTIRSSIHKDKIYNKSDATLKIIVSDDGTGIRVNPISRIFKYGVSTKFNSDDNTLYNRFNNFCKKVFFLLARVKLSELKYSPRGIGLAVVKKYIESYGGTIKAYNNDDSPGASFVMTIPIEEIKIG